VRVARPEVREAEGHAEVTELDDAPGADQEIRGLHVAVDDARAMGRVQR
jgi:hypothetical protein